MKKLGSVVRYECQTSIKYVGVFYVIEYLIIGALFIIFQLQKNGGVSGLELNSFIFVGVLGVLGFKEDFKMLIQNGFTRKVILLATGSLFVFISAVMSLVDTVIGTILNSTVPNYHTLFGDLYGNNAPFLIKWIWLFFLYLFVCFLTYLTVLIANKIGKTASIITGVLLVLVIFLVVPFTYQSMPKEVTNSLLLFIAKTMGFMADGTINMLNPILSYLIAAVVLGGLSFLTLRRTELKA